METTEEQNSPKRTVERSASYPGISLEEAVDFVNNVAKNFSLSQIVNREDISTVLKLGAVHRQVAAAVQYSLLIKLKDGYQISPLFKSIKNPLSDIEKKKFLLEAFGSPKLFKDLIEKFDGHVVPSELKTHLTRFHDIVEKVAPQAAEIFLLSAEYCDALTANNILQYSHALKKYSNPNVQFAEVIPQDDTQKGEQKNEVDYQKNDTIKLLTDGVNSVEYKELPIPLSDNKTAYIKYPKNLTEKDIKILKLQVELLELTI